jgi:Rrf2 family transcriptional regulator, nitric oxide-sensitive transcriptional repressor
VLAGYTLQDLADKPNAVSRALGEAPLPMPRAARRKGVAA